MKILHIAYLENRKDNGINIVIPQIINVQMQYCININFVNLSNVYIDKIKCDNNLNLNINQDYRDYIGEVDLIIIHGIYDMKIFRYYLKYIKNKAPYITVPHGGLTLNSQKKSSLKKVLANKMFFKKYFLNSTAVQFLSIEELENSIHFYKKYIICGNGINVNIRREYFVKRRKVFKLIYIGRFDIQYKGLDLMIKAINNIKKYCVENNIKLDMYGTGNEKKIKVLKRLIKKYDLKRIVTIYPNGIFSEQKKKALLDCDFFIQTSRSEGLSLGVLEVFSYGIPSILTKGVGMEHLLKSKNCGILCDTDVKSISEKIKFAYNMSFSDIERISINAYEISKHYDWNKVTASTIKTYEDLLNA